MAPPATARGSPPGTASRGRQPEGKLAALYPDGRLFNVISVGKGNMGGYQHNIALRDRWAVVAYVRALQTARKAPYDAVKEAFDKGIAGQVQ